MRQLGIGLLSLVVVSGWAANKNKPVGPIRRVAMAEEQVKQSGFHLQDMHAWSAVSCKTDNNANSQDCHYEYTNILRNADEIQDEAYQTVKMMKHDLEIMLKDKCDEPNESCQPESMRAYERLKRRARIVELTVRLIEDYYDLINETHYRVGYGRYGGNYKNVADIVKNLRFIQAQVKSDYRTNVELMKSELEKFISMPASSGQVDARKTK